MLPSINKHDNHSNRNPALERPNEPVHYKLVGNIFLSSITHTSTNTSVDHELCDLLLTGHW